MYRRDHEAALARIEVIEQDLADAPASSNPARENPGTVAGSYPRG